MPNRTTLSLDDDVRSRLDREVRRTGRPFRRVVNDALRRGLDADPPPVEPFVVRPHEFGARLPIDYDDVSALIERLEGPEHR